MKKPLALDHFHVVPEPVPHIQRAELRRVLGAEYEDLMTFVCGGQSLPEGLYVCDLAAWLRQRAFRLPSCG